MKHEYIIKGDNILLRPLEENYIEILRCWRNKKEIQKWFLNSRVINKEEQIKWFENYINNNDEIMFIIESSDLNIPVGAIALCNIDRENNMAEPGRLMIGEEIARGKFMGTKALKLLCNFALSELNMKEIYINVIANNRAIKIYERLGFKHVCKYVHEDKDVVKMNMVR
ncbi:MAG TPA: hypothetical protein DEP72_08540 [Clostridiales bacterium]|nr:MAG: hypothetical protein A2Y18_07275 [Clostridiales bacterium GWD2_32_19]HCC08185.1 hypothetical protein [Clostridiales bacterium]